MNNLPISKYVIIGSYALGIRYAKDIDVICYRKDIHMPVGGDEYVCSFQFNNRTIECLLADQQESLQFILSKYDSNCKAVFEDLFCIKAGHITNPHKFWEKHIHDYHFLKYFADTTSSRVKSLIKLHRKCTKQRIGNIKTPKLIGVSKDQFFDDRVVKYYVHDHIHMAMAHKDRPMYEYMQNDLRSVECSKSLWDAFTEQEKSYCILEEAYVIALERHIIPAEKKNAQGLRDFEAFKWALMRICTTLCSGWFRQYAVDNYYNVLNQYDKGYVAKFKRNIDLLPIVVLNDEGLVETGS